ncbi:MAG: ABC transporter ATP-binding protein [Armatimonadota bacterium]
MQGQAVLDLENKTAVAEMKERLNGLVRPDEELLLCVSADVAEEGRFGERWVVMTPERLLVAEKRNGSVAAVKDVPVQKVKSARAEALVGAGVLEVTLDDGRQEVLASYTSSLNREFAWAAKSIEEYAKEGRRPAPLLTDEDGRKLICHTCKGIIPPWLDGICPRCLKKSRTLGRIMAYAAPYKVLCALAVAITLVQLAVDLVPPYFNKILLDGVFNFQNGWEMAKRGKWLVMIVLAMAGLRLLGTGLASARGFITAWLGARVTFDVRAQLYQYLQRLTLRFYDKKQTGNLISRMSNDTNNLHWLVVDMIPDLVVNSLQLVGITAVLFWMNWKLAIWVLVPAPAVAVVSVVFMRRIHRVYGKQWHLWARMHEVINNALSGIRIVKAFAQEEQEVRRFSGRNTDLFTAQVRAERTWATFWPPMAFLTRLGGLLVWVFGGRQVLGGEITIGVLMAFMGYLGMFYGPISFLPRLNDWISRSLTAAERIFEVLDSEPEAYEDPEAVPMPRIEGKVEFRNVVFGYDKYKPVLHNISFTVEPGKMIGLVGHSGAGKTTVINLLCRFYDPDEGQILIDGVDIRKIRLEDLRRQIGIVPQEPFLFSGTVAENISYGKPNATRDEIIQAAIAANAHDFIMRMPDGYDSQVGDRGGRLSGGEKQMIAIARAILHNPRILILDEATSSMDSETEKHIQDALARLVESRTTFAIAHRLSTLNSADHLLVLDHGRVVEYGTHEELMERQGTYYRLVQLQAELSKTVAVGG